MHRGQAAVEWPKRRAAAENAALTPVRRRSGSCRRLGQRCSSRNDFEEAKQLREEGKSGRWMARLYSPSRYSRRYAPMIIPTSRLYGEANRPIQNRSRQQGCPIKTTYALDRRKERLDHGHAPGPAQAVRANQRSRLAISASRSSHQDATGNTRRSSAHWNRSADAKGHVAESAAPPPGAASINGYLFAFRVDSSGFELGIHRYLSVQHF